MISQEPVISAKNLSKKYGTTVAVEGVSFDIHKSEIFGILGTNGAGKTTTVEMLEGLRRPDDGISCVLGDDTFDRRRVKHRIGVQLQSSSLYPNLTVREVMRLFITFYPKRRCKRPEDLMSLFGLESKADTRVCQLSGGQSQRLSVALALVNNPDLVFLDEPTTGMDPQARRRLWDIMLDLKQKGTTIVLTTHFMDEAQKVCDRIALFHGGRIIELDTPEALIERYCGNVREDVGVAVPSLEDVFIKLTGRVLRD